ncbi:MAG TPA: hypothetical protein VM757_05895 [Sphingomicrobium sp.]|nr:hypothetical protein [Sphingomicrobium sp.]
MRTTVHQSGIDPRQFGRRRPIAVAAAAPAVPSDDLRLFLYTFAAGFLAVSIYLA